DVRIHRRQQGDDDDRCHQGGGEGQTGGLDHGHERRLRQPIVGPRQDEDDDGHGPDVEEEDAPHDGLDRLADAAFGVRGLGRGHRDDLDAAEGEGDDEQPRGDAGDAGGHEAVGEDLRGRIGRGPAEEIGEAEEEEEPDEGDLDEREPEFELTEAARGGQIDGGEDEHDRQGDDPLGDRWNVGGRDLGGGGGLGSDDEAQLNPPQGTHGEG